MSSALQDVAQALAVLSKQQKRAEYSMPNIWFTPFDNNGEKTLSNPSEFYLEQIRSILRYKITNVISDSTWLNTASVYSMYIRHTTAYDHDKDGVIATGLNRNGWRETGTFLKSIVLLPYIKDLGCNTIHLLPVFSTGKVGKKGNMGSPYSIKNPYVIEPTLAEPMLVPSPEVQYQAFIEAAHRLDMKVIQEFALRTVSRDSDWIEEHPEWFYWITSNIENNNTFSPPRFEKHVIDTIELKVKSGNFDNLPIPDDSYRKQFVVPKEIVEFTTNEGYGGITENGDKCTVPGAFADYPPDDTQPLWSDVTYLKLYNNPAFNYMAYNTVRMYDTDLATSECEQKELWQRLSGVIPFYQKQYKVDGALLDMSHALPTQLRELIISKARRNKPDFVFIEENFTISDESKHIGFNAVVGDSWYYTSSTDSFSEFIQKHKSTQTEILFFGALGSHNTPRIAGKMGVSKIQELLIEISELPNAIRFTLSGDEIGEITPINTGLGFTPKEAETFPVDVLPLFSTGALQWENSKLEYRAMYKSVLNTQRDNN